MTSTPKIGIVGAGAIGCALAAKLALAGTDVTIVARGERAAALHRDGLTLIEDGAVRRVTPRIVSVASLGDRDLVVAAVKAHALTPLLPDLARVMAPQAWLLPAINGLPWWYFAGTTPPPGFDAQSPVAPERLLGCVVYTRAIMPNDATVETFGSQHLRIGRVVAGEAPADIAAALRDAGVDVETVADIRREMWRKLARNAATNLVSGLTGATLGEIRDDAGLAGIATAIVAEVNALSARLGHAADVDDAVFLDELHRAGPFITSMLQDVRAGRTPEIDAIATRVIELGAVIGQPTPVLNHVTALLRAKLRRPPMTRSA